MPTDATPAQILTNLDGVFGNIYPTEKLIQQFYATQQEERETVVDYGLRLARKYFTEMHREESHQFRCKKRDAQDQVMVWVEGQ